MNKGNATLVSWQNSERPIALNNLFKADRGDLADVVNEETSNDWINSGDSEEPIDSNGARCSMSQLHRRAGSQISAAAWNRPKKYSSDFRFFSEGSTNRKRAFSKPWPRRKVTRNRFRIRNTSRIFPQTAKEAQKPFEPKINKQKQKK